tara:strand:- start:2571 stop:2915 length:345 start_codon:yes stop_codon:yes gene_type:complete
MEVMPIRAHEPRQFQILYKLPYNRLDRHIKLVSRPMSIIASILSLPILLFKSSKKPAGPSPRSGCIPWPERRKHITAAYKIPEEFMQWLEMMERRYYHRAVVAVEHRREETGFT